MKRSGIELSEVYRNARWRVSMRSAFRRLLTSGVEIMLRKRGQSSHVGHVHPHKFRRTMATTAIDRGMPIEQVQTLLGHEKIDTTLMYAMVNQTNVKIAIKSSSDSAQGGSSALLFLVDG